VLQVAYRHDIPNLFENSVAFKVPREFLERVFRETYGLELDDLFVNYDVALNTYRWGFRTLLDEGTGIAWALYQPQIQALEPGLKRSQFVQSMSRTDFTREFGKVFLQPGYFARFASFVANLVPNIGPLKRLPYKPLPAEVQKFYFDAYRNAFKQYLREVAFVADGKILLPNLILDTGAPDRAGTYEPADKAYAALLELHAKDHFARMPRLLALDVLRHFQDRTAAVSFEDNRTRRDKLVSEVNELAQVESTPGATASRSEARVQ
jgi:hypothetical protein